MLEDLKDDAKDYFGTTNYWKIAFYINTDGTLLDGSGKKFGSSGSSRTLDHREVADIMADGTEGTEAMLKYMEEGNIRFQPEARNFEIMKKPTLEQYDKLEELIDEFYDEVNIDIDDANGNSVAHFFHDYDEPASKIIAQVKRYFINKESLIDSVSTMQEAFDLLESLNDIDFSIAGFDMYITDTFEDEGVIGHNIIYTKNGEDIVEVEVWEEDSPVSVIESFVAPNLFYSTYDSFQEFAADLEYKTKKYVK